MSLIMNIIIKTRCDVFQLPPHSSSPLVLIMCDSFLNCVLMRDFSTHVRPAYKKNINTSLAIFQGKDKHCRFQWPPDVNRFRYSTARTPGIIGSIPARTLMYCRSAFLRAALWRQGRCYRMIFSQK